MITGIAWLDALIWVLGFLGFGALGGNIVANSINKKITIKMDEDREERRALQLASQKSAILTQKGLCAIGHLSEANAYALKEGKVNGRMETALEYYHEFRDENNAFLQEQAAERLRKGA